VSIALEGKHCRIQQVQLPEHSSPVCIDIDDGKISRIHSDNAELEGNNTLNIQAQNCMAVPGFTDLYTRLREPGLTRKGTIKSEAIAALKAGFTQILCAPDTLPVVDSVATVELIQHRSELANAAQVLPMAALTTGLEGEQLSELATLQSAGCPVASQADRPIANTSVLYSAMEYAASFNLPLIMNARDSQLGVDGCAHTGAMATRLGLPGIPVAAETVALSRLLELCRETECAVHVSRVSSRRATELIDAAKQAGLPVSCDVGIHHLFFSDDLLEGYDASFHNEVPFRGSSDRQALREALSHGVIDAICTDHAPHDKDASLAPFPMTEPGLSAYDWFIPLLLQLPSITDLSLNDVFAKLHQAPASLMSGLQQPQIKEGCVANFSLIALHQAVNRETLVRHSAGANHPLNIHPPEALGLEQLHGAVSAVFAHNRMTDFAG